MTPGERAELAAGYRAEMSALVRGALPLGVLVYLAAFLFPAGHEALFHPERRSLLALHVVGDLLAGALAILAVRRLRGPRAPIWIGVLFLAAGAAVSGGYNAAVGGRAERFVIREMCELTGAALFLPWGPAPQLAALASVLVTLAVAGPQMSSADATSYLWLVLAMGGVLGVGVAAYLDHHRRLTYERGARDREAAAVNATLLHAGRALVPLDEKARIAGETTRLAVDGCRCDWAAVFTWDADAGAHALASTTGPTPAEHARLVAHPPPPDAAAAQPGDPARSALLDAWAARAVIVAALPAADPHPPLLACGWRATAHPLPGRAHRLVQGFAEACALALDAARVVTDLRRTNRLKSEFVSTMSHEMRTPLNVILGCLEMGGDVDLPEADRQDSLQRAGQASRTLLALIEDTLDLGRLDAGADGLELTPIELPRLCQELRAACAALPRSPEVQLTWSDDVASCVVYTDTRKLGVIVRNLVQNALKFTPQGEVSVDVRRVDDTLVVRVTDTGIGIPLEQHAAVFELFRQGDGSDTRRYEGPGLGLHIVRRFVDEFGGHIAFESTPGQGTSFTVRLPAGVDTRPRGSATERTAAAPAANALRRAS